SEEHTSELQSQSNLVCRLLLEKKKTRLLPPRTRALPTVPRLVPGAAHRRPLGRRPATLRRRPTSGRCPILSRRPGDGAHAPVSLAARSLTHRSPRRPPCQYRLPRHHCTRPRTAGLSKTLPPASRDRRRAHQAEFPIRRPPFFF